MMEGRRQFRFGGQVSHNTLIHDALRLNLEVKKSRVEINILLTALHILHASQLQTSTILNCRIDDVSVSSQARIL